MSLPLPAVRLGCVAAGEPEGPVGDLVRRVLEGEIRRRLPEAEVRWLTPRDALGDVDHVVMVGEGLPGVKVGTALEAADIVALAPRYLPAAVVEQRAAFLRTVGALDAHTSATGLFALASDLAERLGASPTAEDLVAFVTESGPPTGDSADPAVTALALAYDRESSAPVEADETLDRIAHDAVRAVARRDGIDPELLQARRASIYAAARAELEAARDAAAHQAAIGRSALAEQLQEQLQANDRLRAEIEVVQGRLAGETERREHLESELEAVYSTRTFRTTSKLRDIYGRVRGSDSQ